MSPRSIIRRGLVIGLAAAALAAPAALAQPVDNWTSAAQSSQSSQDLRNPDNRVQGPVNGGPPTWPAHPQVLHHAAPAANDDGLDISSWQVILAIAGGATLVLVAVAGGFVVRSRTRARVAV